MQTPRSKTFLKIAAIFLMAFAVKTNAKAQRIAADEYRETRKHCKLINNKSQVVIDHSDTLQVYGLETIYEGGQKKIVCDLGPGKAKLVYDPLYYINNPWMVPIYKGDTVAQNKIQRDAQLTYLYYVYESQGDDRRRDSTELLIEENRRQLLERAKRDFSKQY